MSNFNFNRRDFLRTAGAVPLIGTATAAGPYQPQSVAALKGSAKSVVVPTDEWLGDHHARLDFPSNWEVSVMDMKGHNTPALTAQQIAEALSKPAGTKPLREIAAGKKTAVITFDDITRGTPIWAVAPWVVSELKAAGIADDRILFLCATGTHRFNSRADIQKKLGKDIATRYAHTVHNPYINCKELGTTSFKTPVAINQTFMEADVKICLSGMKVHANAGYGGGAKSVLPGVAAFQTVLYNHNVIMPNNPTTGPLKVFKNEMRLDLIEAARLSKVDFTVQIVWGEKLQAAHVFSGDIVDAHHAAARVAAKFYCTPTFKNADIVVANGYPLNTQASHAQEWLPRSVKDGGTGVLIICHPELVDYIHGWANNSAGRGGAGWFTQVERRLGSGGPVALAGGGGRAARGGRPGPKYGLVVYTPYMDQTLKTSYPKGTQFATNWEDVIKILLERHKGDASVAVYPYAGIQHEELELDG